jgi:O-6-methylguanine DNA methyltransferase
MPGEVRFATLEAVGGSWLVGWTDGGIAAIDRGSPDGFLAGLKRRFGRPPAPARSRPRLAKWLADALAGLATELPPVDLRGLSPFDAAVYRAVREVPRGATVTYGEVAAIIGSPGAARAVGGAMSRCPLFPAVPCHRVVRASDGWSGWGGDDRLKRRLLQAERTRPPP